MRSLTLSILALLALAAPASASQVLELRHDGKTVTREIPALRPPLGPEVAVPGGEQRCPLPKAQAAGGPSVRKAIARARGRRTITEAEATRYRRSYALALKAHGKVHARNRRELGSVIAVLNEIAHRGKLTGGRMPALFLQLDRNRQFWH